ncbi:hypothetical protein HELRODRAFT_179010 [Helobdella robusta]|uniref:Uncharacterized protein n=1 Tax=Helobdella robusta TaxID=6412 RepID=T1FE19_HELRO|nr:hypothetical protein HELRODRAFT_179010 [Helobdella robusta]ESN95824.1 hypothetical protein HELRODRAFT_179010 [Helobdella robusta]
MINLYLYYAAETFLLRIAYKLVVDDFLAVRVLDVGDVVEFLESVDRRTSKSVAVMIKKIKNTASPASEFENMDAFFVENTRIKDEHAKLKKDGIKIRKPYDDCSKDSTLLSSEEVETVSARTWSQHWQEQEQRADCKKSLEIAKQKKTAENQDFIYRVRGEPGNMKVVKGGLSGGGNDSDENDYDFDSNDDNNNSDNGGKVGGSETDDYGMILADNIDMDKLQ